MSGADVTMSETTPSTDTEMRTETVQSTAADSIVAGSESSPTDSGTPLPKIISSLDTDKANLEGGEPPKGEAEPVENVKAFKGLQNQGATCYMNSLL